MILCPLSLSMSKNKNKKLVSVQNEKLSIHQVESFSGPLPHPNILQRFNEVVPGAAERIIKMVEDQSRHRQELEKKVVESDIRLAKWGQVLGFVIAISGLVVSAVVSIFGNEIAGGIIGVGTLASLVGVFMYGTKQSVVSEMEEKEE